MLTGAHAHVAVEHLLFTGLTADDQRRLEVAAETRPAVAVLQNMPFNLANVLDEFKLRPAALVIDDVDLLGDVDTVSAACRFLSDAARRRHVPLVITATLDSLPDGALAADLVRACDVILSLDRPDMDDATGLRAGEADITVLSNRRGPVTTVTVGFQGYYGRFHDLTPPDPRSTASSSRARESRSNPRYGTE